MLYDCKTRQNKAKLQPKGGKTCTIRLQKLTLKGGKLAAKVCTVHSNFFSCTPKNLYCIPKNFPKQHLYCKIAISTISHTLGLLISFLHTFSYFPIPSQLLAHCAVLSKSKGQLCCCHETFLKPVLLSVDLQANNSSKACIRHNKRSLCYKVVVKDT